MRVWALASCSGLLALAACSAEQSSPPDLGTAPPDGDDAGEISAQPGLRATSSSPMARPELQSRQVGGLARARFSPRSPQASPRASRSSGTGQTLPQADQLRARLQRLRAQRGLGLSSNTPLATAPLPAALTSTPPRPVPQAAGEELPETPPAAHTIAIARPGLEPSQQPAGVTALPPLPRPNVAAPELGLTSTASTAIDLGAVAATNRADSYSVALGRHQGYSTRSQPPTITPVATESPEGLTARLHGTPSVPSLGAPAAIAAQPSPPATPASAQAETPVPEAVTLATAPLATAQVGAAPAAADGSATAHQSSVIPVLTLTPQPVAASAPAALAHRSQGRAVRPETATPLGIAPQGRAATIASPESLPLNPGTPRLSPLRPAAAASPSAPLTVPEAAASQVLEAQPSAIQTSDEAAESQILGSQTPSATFSTHQGQLQPESLSLSPQPEASPKDLPAAYCLQASGLPPNAEAQPGTDPQGTDRLVDQLAAIPPGSADAAPGLGGRLSKAEPAPCLGQNGDADADDSRFFLPLN